MQIHTNTTDRKEMVKKIADFTGNQIKYMGPPTFNYMVGQLVIDRDGVILSGEEEGMESLMTFLQEEGYLEEQGQKLNVTIPIGSNAAAHKHLIFMLHARSYLLNRITGYETFAISDRLVQSLTDDEPGSYEEFTVRVAQDEGQVKGITFEEENVIFAFPLSEKPEKNKAYTDLAARMVARAKEAKRVSTDPVIVENEKYYLRIWLVQLGFGGKNSKESRNALLEGLKGHTAFRTKEEADKFSADQKAKREAAKAARQAEMEAAGDEVSE